MASKPEYVSPTANFSAFSFTAPQRKISIDTNNGSWDSAEGCKKPRVVYLTRNVMDWETELITSFDAIVHRDFPNFRRIGCPGRDSLVGLAVCLGDAHSALVLAHIRQCAPCFDELKELRKKQSGGDARQR
jgi:hypothetical protein